MDAAKLDALVEQLAANQARHEQQLAELDQMDAFLREMLAAAQGLDPVLIQGRADHGDHARFGADER